MSALKTPHTFRATHGAPDTWCGAEFDEYLAACDRTVDVHERLERAAAVAEAGGSTPEILDAFSSTPGGAR